MPTRFDSQASPQRSAAQPRDPAGQHVAFENGVELVLDELRRAGTSVVPHSTGRVHSELWIAEPTVVPGHWANAQATAASFTAGWSHPGDVRSVDAQGYVRIFDLNKDMLDRGGYKTYSVELENALRAWPGVLEAAVGGRPCPVLDERVHAFVHAPGVAR